VVIHSQKRSENPHFNCFGCGAKGNILDFVTLKEGGDPE
jgi:DNA primase